MKILILSDINSSHTQKWVSGLTENNVEVYVFSLTPITDASKPIYKNIPFHTLNYTVQTGNTSRKVLYLKAVPTVRKLIKEFNPDVVHAHYASSYGLIGALSGFENYAISVWGTDVYVYPKQSILFKNLLSYALSKAKSVFSTSRDMAKETSLYYSGTPKVISFGVNCDLFHPPAEKRSESPLKFATAKSLKPVYNIPLAIRAFVRTAEAFPEVEMELHIAGDGPERKKCLAEAEGKHRDRIFFCGHVAHRDMPAFYADKHVLINIPDSESFGVSVIEASASGLAVIATDAGGLPEVVVEGETGYLIPSATIEEVSNPMRTLVTDIDSIHRLGIAGRAFVLETYDARLSVSMQIEAYREMIGGNS